MSAIRAVHNLRFATVLNALCPPRQILVQDNQLFFTCESTTSSFQSATSTVYVHFTTYTLSVVYGLYAVLATSQPVSG